MTDSSLGPAMHALATELFPICRSITGEGVRKTLDILRRELPGLRTFEVASGSRAFDWTVPPEWNIREARITGPDGETIVDFRDNNLHVVSYSHPVDAVLSLEDLQKNLHSLPEQPDAIPYLTSYYKSQWGFCLTQRQREALKPGQYRALIDSTIAAGHLTYGELLIPGDSPEEIFLSTYVCHPSMANNELSGPVVATFLAKWLLGLEKRRYSYRIIFIPETIGSIVYLSRHLDLLKLRVIAGFNLSCIGDDRAYSYLPSRSGQTLADRAALHALSHLAPGFVRYSFLDRGSDERQYCSPGVDLPVASIMRSKYSTYPEYHTSKDDLSLVSPAGLFGGYEVLRHCLMCLEHNETLKLTVLCEPHLSSRGLYPTLSTKDVTAAMARMMDLLAYSDGQRDLIAIAETILQPMWTLFDIVDQLKQHGLLAECKAA